MRFILIRTKLLTISLFCLLLPAESVIAQRSQIELPSLGAGGSSIISLEEERQLGDAWLRSYYRQTPLNRDYLLQDYMEELVARLKPFASIEGLDLKILVLDNPSLNAFAVPGGVIGVHSGLLLKAGSEGELASVIAHEMAHLSQRHFARSVANQQSGGLMSLAGLLAAVVLSATSGSDAGLAMLSITQGAALESQLRYSRQNETEADRIGQETLFQAGMDPKSTVRMFEKMLASTRYAGELAPEYLLSHPLPQSRVIDAQTRATQFPIRMYPENPNYQFMAARVKVANNETPELALRNFENAFKQTPDSNLAKYGYALALQGTRNYSAAMELSQQLLASNSNNLIFQTLYAELLLNTQQRPEAVDYLLTALKSKPKNHVLAMLLAECYTKLNQSERAAQVLKQHTLDRPADPIVWYELAESYGLAGNIYELHLARAQYFQLVGSFDRAIEHVRLAKKELGDNPIEQAVLDQRIRQIAQIQAQERKL